MNRKFAALALALAAMLLVSGCNADKTPAPAPAAPVTISIGQSIYPAHGTSAWAVASVAMEGDKIVAVWMDEYQYMAVATTKPVPNADNAEGLGQFMPQSEENQRIIGSKRVNWEAYSANMKERGGATISLLDNYLALEAFATGKTVAELEAAIAGKESGKAIDAVAGCTLVDTKGYLEAVIEAAKNVKAGASVPAGSEIKIGQSIYPAHGTSAWAVATVAMSGDTVVASWMDEYQFMAVDTTKAVPNADNAEGLGQFMPQSEENQRILGSKRTNWEAYSVNMKERGGATHTLLDNYKALEAFANGKTLAELESTIAGKTAGQPIDAVAGCTLVDAKGYLESFIEAGKNVK